MADADKLAKERRIAERRPLPEQPVVFYHVSCMGNWREVVREQLRLIRHVGLSDVRTHIIGQDDECAEVIKMMSHEGVDALIYGESHELRECEHPTLCALQRWLRDAPLEFVVLYLHTKGVSVPHDRNKVHWRRLMQKHVVAGWRENMTRLRTLDAVGVDWQDSQSFPHFSGNFWMARTDWLRELPDLSEFRARHGNMVICGNSWYRMHAEMWLGSRAYHDIESLCCRNENLWEGPTVFRHDVSIPGFTY